MAPTSFRVDRKDSCEEEKIRHSLHSNKPVGNNFSPLVVALVGLPGRGKTVLAHKLAHYLNFTGHSSKVFSVSCYRRKHIELYNSHDLFRADNEEAYEIRKQSAKEAMEDCTEWLQSDGDIAILDGTHATLTMRQRVQEYFSKNLGFKVMFVECICDDKDLLEKNMKETLELSNDYKDMGREKAKEDFCHKIEHYLEQYETINPKAESRFTYVKCYNGGENLTVHRINGPHQGKILSFLSSYRPQQKTLYFSRHGESEFNVLGRIGGDTNLSPRGQMYASALSRHINDAHIPDLHVWTSEKRRTKQTAAGIAAPTEHIAALNELDAGVCEEMSYEEMQEKFPQEFAWRDQDKLRYRYPWGESYIDIMARLEPVLLELEREDNLLVVSHQAVLRCILGYFLNKDFDELPYINVPLHTIIKLTTEGYKCRMEFIKLNVECVDTYRKQPKVCSVNRTNDDALLTVPSHFDSLNIWSRNNSLIEQR
uniref:6-phosphofructo-2-kinase domain-containing protein n=2 Tax=Clastoptera arizonana TaxID=38151 RepID=A0A1B6D337_9HEMI